MHLGGIYALEGVMNASPEYRWSVLEALCSFVRDGTAGKKVGDKPASDIQAALTVIGRRGAFKELGLVNLTGVNIPGANLIGANLVATDLDGANLRGAKLIGKLAFILLRDADLRDATLTGDLTNAFLNRADLRGADLRYAHLDGADLRGAHLDGQKQLDQTCGSEVELPEGLTLKPCPEPVASPLNQGGTR